MINIILFLKILFDKIKGNDGKYSLRSRPYKKNDNAHVEQKDGDKVRKLVGYFRYDSKEEAKVCSMRLTREQTY